MFDCVCMECVCCWLVCLRCFMVLDCVWLCWKTQLIIIIVLRCFCFDAFREAGAPEGLVQAVFCDHDTTAELIQICFYRGIWLTARANIMIFIAFFNRNLWQSRSAKQSAKSSEMCDFIDICRCFSQSAWQSAWREQAGRDVKSQILAVLGRNLGSQKCVPTASYHLFGATHVKGN